MASVNFINGGLDVQGIVDNLIFVEREPIRKLESQSKTFQDKVSAYQTFNTKLLALQTSTEDVLYQDSSVLLNTPAAFNARLKNSIFALRKATSSNENVVTATANKGLTIGNFSVTVSNLAETNTHASNNFASDTTTKTKTGTLVIQKGSATAVTVTIDSTSNTLQGIKNAINNQNAGFTASIINDGSSSPYKLVITSDDSGTANALTITNNLTQGSDATVTLSQTVAAEDAVIIVNGLTVTKSSNTITDAIEDVTLNLKAESATAVNVLIERDVDSIVSGVKDFVAKYNDVASFISSQSKFDTTTETAGILAGDTTLRDAQSKIQSLITQSVSNSLGALSIISEAGIEFNRDGTLTLNEADLKSALEKNFNDVPALLLGDSSGTSILFELQSSLKGFTNTLDGSVQNAQDGVQKNIDRLKDQIADFEDRLAVRREILILEFSRADEALRQLSALQASLASQIGSLSF